MANLNSFTNSGLEEQVSSQNQVLAGTPAAGQKRESVIPSDVVPQGTIVTHCHINRNWQPGANTWMANVDIVTDERLYLNNINVRNKNDGGVWVDYPTRDRVRNGQVVKNEQGYNEKDPWYLPFKNDAIDGIDLMNNQMIIPMAQQANSSPDGKYVEDPNDFGHSSYMYKSQYSYAFGRVVTQGLPIRVFNLWVRAKQNEDGSLVPFISWPSAPKMQNGAQVMDANGKPEYINYVFPAKEARDAIVETIAMHVQSEFEKLATSEG